MRYPQSNSKIDWWTIILYFALVGFGWLNIYSASMSTTQDIWDLNQIYSKQLVWILLSVVLIVFILAVEAKFYERFSSLIYLFALAALVGLYVFGQTVNGATSWYAFGGFSIQPSEFAKTATALALGKFVGDIHTNQYTFMAGSMEILTHHAVACPVDYPPARPRKCPCLRCFYLTPLSRGIELFVFDLCRSARPIVYWNPLVRGSGYCPFISGLFGPLSMAAKTQTKAYKMGAILNYSCPRDWLCLFGKLRILLCI